MKPLNYKEVRKGYLAFSCVMVVVITIPVLMCYSLYLTAAHEAKMIESRGRSFDRTFARQIELVDRVDSLYTYMSLLNTDPRINDVVVQGVISSKKMSLINHLPEMDKRDVLLYKDLLNLVNDFLTLKDSIRIVTNEEQTVRLELQRCMAADQNASRRLSLEGLRTNNYIPQQ